MRSKKYLPRMPKKNTQIDYEYFASNFKFVLKLWHGLRFEVLHRRKVNRKKSGNKKQTIELSTKYQK